MRVAHYGWQICSGVAADFRNKQFVAEQCLSVANAANFPTDFDDVYSHLFGQDDYIVCLALDEEKQIGGFSVFAKLEEINTLHLHGIVLHPRAQGHGLSTKMVKNIAKEAEMKYLTAKTHNPRVYETLTNLACEAGEFYPKIDTYIPESVYELVRKNEFISMADENLIVREAYPDEKIMQSFRNPDI